MNIKIVSYDNELLVYGNLEFVNHIIISTIQKVLIGKEISTNKLTIDCIDKRIIDKFWRIIYEIKNDIEKNERKYYITIRKNSESYPDDTDKSKKFLFAIMTVSAEETIDIVDIEKELIAVTDKLPKKVAIIEYFPLEERERDIMNQLLMLYCINGSESNIVLDRKTENTTKIVKITVNKSTEDPELISLGIMIRDKSAEGVENCYLDNFTRKEIEEIAYSDND